MNSAPEGRNPAQITSKTTHEYDFLEASCVCHLLAQKYRHVVERLGHIRVMRAKRLLAHGEGALMQAFGFLMFALKFDEKRNLNAVRAINAEEMLDHAARSLTCVVRFGWSGPSVFSSITIVRSMRLQILLSRAGPQRTKIIHRHHGPYEVSGSFPTLSPVSPTTTPGCSKSWQPLDVPAPTISPGSPVPSGTVVQPRRTYPDHDHQRVSERRWSTKKRKSASTKCGFQKYSHLGSHRGLPRSSYAYPSTAHRVVWP